MPDKWVYFDALQKIQPLVSLAPYLLLCTVKQIHKLLYLCSLGTGKEAEDANLLQQLSDACLVVDALEPSVREELVKNFCSKELISYKQIFEGAGQNLAYPTFFSCIFHFITSVHTFGCIVILILPWWETELAKLDKTERRYAWIKRRLRSNEDTWKIFPPSWHVDYLLCIQFCKITRFDSASPVLHCINFLQI
jgi:hypothetical protein